MPNRRPSGGSARSPLRELADALKARAAELGFLACGITDPGPPPHADRLDAWLAKGYAGTMRYLHRQAERRKNPRLNVPEARAVVVVLENYYSPDAEADLEAPRVASTPGARTITS